MEEEIKKLPAKYFKYFTENLGTIYSGKDNAIDICDIDDINNIDGIHLIKRMELSIFKHVEDEKDIDGDKFKFIQFDNLTNNSVFTSLKSKITNSNIRVSNFYTNYLKDFINNFIKNCGDDDELFAIIPIINRVNFDLIYDDGDFDIQPTLDKECEFCGWHTMSYCSYPTNDKDENEISGDTPLSNLFTRTFTCVTGKNKFDLFRLQLEINNDISKVYVNFTTNAFKDINCVSIDFYAVPLKVLKLGFIKKYLNTRI